MSLLDGLILDSFVNPPLVKEEVWFAVSTNTTYFKSVIARNNVFRRPLGSATNNSEVALSFKNCTAVVVENNVADVGTSLNNLASYSVCSVVKAFNNRKPDGTFSAAYNTATSLHLAELTDTRLKLK